MRNRFSTTAKHTAHALCVLAACGLSWACSDDYKWDDEKPTWLNSSIYESLQEGMKDENGQVIHTFSNYLRLLDDKDVNPEGVRNLKDVLSKTGSKTVFVADDNAWQQFFQRNATLPANNPWHNATSYERLSAAQKKLLIHTSMLNNAIVMENLASSDGNGTDAPMRGQYMRRYTDVDLVDSVTFLPAEEVPTTFNPDDDTNRNFWKEFDTRNGGKGIYLVMDSTRSMMLHFTQEHMANHLITNDDFRRFMGRDRATRDVHIYDALLLKQDGVAENGYVNLTEKVVTPLPNMAELIRTNGKTNIFSHMLDRFSYPYQNAAVTENYKKLHPEFNGIIYTKRYFSLVGAGNKSQTLTPTGKAFDTEAYLQFDPGWNEFRNEYDAREDMAAMFVPNDEAMLEYFSEGGAGWQLVQTYATDPYAEVNPNDLTTLYQKIDMVPLSTLYKLINVIMFPSFNGSVPSKMTQLRDYESQENMFTPDDVNEIDTCMLACNGAVYVMNKVYGPASYISVAAPANISKTNMIMKWAINNGADQSNDQMHLNYSAYLMAMRSQFTFFLTSDEALTRCYDPVSLTNQHPRVIRFSYINNTALPVQIGKINYRYDPANGTIGEQYRSDELAKSELINRLKDILESHTIVHDGTNPIDNEDEYYVAKNYSALKVTKDDQHRVTRVQGGFQLENERAGIVGGERGTVEVGVTPSNTNKMANGTTFVIDDSPILPTSKSIYNIINKEFGEQCSSFYDLTDMNIYEEVIKACGLKLNKINVWLDGNSGGGIDYNVKFFSNYGYTVFVPTNDAIERARQNGLATWDDIMADYESLPEDEDGTGKRILNGADSLRLQAKITFLSNFVRAHFVDNSIFADKSERPEDEYVTSSYDTELGSFVKVHISRQKVGGETTLFVRDDQGGEKFPVVGNLKNIMARDVTCLKDPNGDYSGSKFSPTGKSNMNNIVVQSASYAVVHQIDGVLNHTHLENGQYPRFDTVSECKAYLRQHPIVDIEYDEPVGDTMRKVKKCVIR